MKIFAHRANLHGQDKTRENSLISIKECLDNKFNVEIDVIKVGNKLYLGHDGPKQEINREFLIDDRLLVHAKNVHTFEYLLQFPNIHSFFQKDDLISFTSQGYRVYHEDVIGDINSDKAIVVDLNCSYGNYGDAYGVITDYGYNLSTKFDFKERKEKAFKLLILDVDGVLTNGKKTYDKEHNVLSKEFCDRDFTAIKRFKSAGIPVLLLSGDTFNGLMGIKRTLPFFNARTYSEQLDKSIAIEKIAKEYRTELGSVAYVGDDYYDLSALNVVGHPYCPTDAADIVKQSAIVLNKKGGEGAIEALYELVKNKLNQRYPYE